MKYNEYCDQIVVQAGLFAQHLIDADLATPVPTCPGWTVGQLVRHVGGAHREAEQVAQKGRPPGQDDFRDPTHFTDTDPVQLGAWLVEGANRLAAELRAAGPDKAVATPVADQTTKFVARRMTHETAIHRADAALALASADRLETGSAIGSEYGLQAELAVDGIDEWMELCALPLHFEVHPWMRELLGPGRTLHFHATDTQADWLVDLTGDVIAWRHADEEAAVAVRGTVLDLLLLIYKRRPVETVEVLGDRELLDFYLDRVSFG
ncbi:maleylpyruvate isomerase family mycothiol-dependent enzyme [Kribbella monticola]|uniref:maleylpyruvate isomerase family mycothiol-dependent enzyme n=1 Tax=Kribbella monticola TaxID=2185285 RepID=UPI000DD41678|nr:maleylpyruvate isomerase family mycothiol-dependent enzyme [Kribbella monticola]